MFMEYKCFYSTFNSSYGNQNASGLFAPSQLRKDKNDRVVAVMNDLGQMD